MSYLKNKVEPLPCIIEYPYVSVIICIYNGENILELAINSILNQEYPNNKYEIVLVDDGSTDMSSQICHELIVMHKNKYPKITYVLQENGGLSSGRNTGIHYSKGQLIAFIDQDAVADQEWINTLVVPFLTQKKILVAGGMVENLNEKNWFSSFIHKVHYKPAILSSKNVSIVGTNMIFRREAFNYSRGFFNIFNHLGDETAFISHLFKKVKGMKKIFVPKAIVKHQHPESILSWLKQRYHNGRLFCFIQKKIESKGSMILILIKSLSKTIILMFIPYVFIHIIFGGSNVVLLTLMFIFFLRFLNIRKYLFISFRQTELHFGKFLSVLGLIVIVVGQIYCDIGYALEGMASFKKDPSEMEQSAGIAIKSTTNIINTTSKI